ncbi:MAG: transporter [Sulfobacillus thermosulfidooxidans]|nr:MAG: transporter [Sulfobacillus thermosulfidooxidans]
MKSSSIAVAMAYVGTVIGAGFASGQEIWQFFSRFGLWGGWGIAVAALGFALVGWLALERGRAGVHDFGTLLASVYPPWAAYIAEGLTTAFLVVGVVVVVSGGGAALAFFSLPSILGKALTLLVIIAVASRGGNAVTIANSFIVPYLIMMTVAVAWLYPHNLLTHGSPDHSWAWALSALLYVSYNLFTALMVLLALGSRLTSFKSTGVAAGLGGAILGLLAFLEHGVLLRLSVIGDLPMLTAAHQIHPVLGFLFAASLWLALMTTGIGGAFALGERFGRSRLWWLVFTIILTPLSFKTLVSLLYPVMGVLAVMLWLPLFVTPTRSE